MPHFSCWIMKHELWKCWEIKALFTGVFPFHALNCNFIHLIPPTLFSSQTRKSIWHWKIMQKSLSAFEDFFLPFSFSALESVLINERANKSFNSGSEMKSLLMQIASRESSFLYSFNLHATLYTQTINNLIPPNSSRFRRTGNNTKEKHFFSRFFFAFLSFFFESARLRCLEWLLDANLCVAVNYDFPLLFSFPSVDFSFLYCCAMNKKKWKYFKKNGWKSMLRSDLKHFLWIFKTSEKFFSFFLVLMTTSRFEGKLITSSLHNNNKAIEINWHISNKVEAFSHRSWKY